MPSLYTPEHIASVLDITPEEANSLFHQSDYVYYEEVLNNPFINIKHMDNAYTFLFDVRAKTITVKSEQFFLDSNLCDFGPQISKTFWLDSVMDEHPLTPTRAVVVNSDAGVVVSADFVSEKSILDVLLSQKDSIFLYFDYTYKDPETPDRWKNSSALNKPHVSVFISEPQVTQERLDLIKTILLKSLSNCGG